jgi:hypothetical protein
VDREDVLRAIHLMQPAQRTMKDWGSRAMTGAVYVALTLGAAFSGPFTTFLLFLPVCGMAAYDPLHLL